MSYRYLFLVGAFYQNGCGAPGDARFPVKRWTRRSLSGAPRFESITPLSDCQAFSFIAAIKDSAINPRPGELDGSRRGSPSASSCTLRNPYHETTSSGIHKTETWRPCHQMISAGGTPLNAPRYSTPFHPAEVHHHRHSLRLPSMPLSYPFYLFISYFFFFYHPNVIGHFLQRDLILPS